jgi:hypothetical protein
MYGSRTLSRTVLPAVCLTGLVVSSGCGLFPQIAPPKEIPAEISAVIANRDSVRVMEDDPFFHTQPGTVIDDLGGLDGCWASYVNISSPQDTPFFPAGTPLMDTYEFYRLDFQTAQMEHQVYGELTVASFASTIAYDGTFTIDGDNRLEFTVHTMRTFDPFTGDTLIFPDDLLSMMEASDEYDEETRGEMLAELQADMIWEYLVTLDGDRVLFVPVWDDEETGEEVADPNEASVCVRFDCPR